MGILTNFLKLLKPEPNDFVDVAKHISENYDKLDKNAETTNQTLTNLSNNKLDKGTYSGDASDLNTEISKIASTTQLGRIIVGDNLTINEAGRLSGEKVDLSNYYDKPEIEEKFKNFCPFPVNSLFLSLGTENPATLFLGTTWQKQEGRFLLGSNSSYALGSTGGSATTTLSEANIPRHRHQVDSTTATIPEHTHTINTGTDDYRRNDGRITWGGTQSYRGDYSTNSAGGGSTGAMAPYTNYVGSGTAFNNMPPYLVVNIWKRLT